MTATEDIKTEYTTDRSRSIWVAIAAGLALWFAVIFTLASRGAFQVPAGTPPLPTMLAVALPVAGFLGFYATSTGVREFVDRIDLRFLTVIHAWRTVGFSFIVLHLMGDLPGLFAWPAGLGDISVALTAPYIAWRLGAKPEFAASRRFAAWHAIGILDFVVAVGIGVLASGGFQAIYQPAVSMAPTTVMPLILIPGFFVPFLTITHLAAILKSRRLARETA